MNIVQPSALPLAPELIARFREIVGDKYAVTDAADIAPYVTEERDLFHGRHLQACQRTQDRAGAAGRQYRSGRRTDPPQWRGGGLDAANGQGP
jgi:hypothetical protein